MMPGAKPEPDTPAFTPGGRSSGRVLRAPLAHQPRTDQGDHADDGADGAADTVAAVVDLAGVPDRVERAHAHSGEEQDGQDDEDDADHAKHDDQAALRASAARANCTHFSSPQMI